MSELAYLLVGALLVIAIAFFLSRSRRQGLRGDIKFYSDGNLTGIVLRDSNYWKKHDPDDKDAFKARALEGFKLLDELEPK